MRFGWVALATAAAMTWPAMAQQIGDKPAGAPDAQATDDEDKGGGLPDVIVTARRRAEDAQKVPGSLSVVGGNLLDQSYTTNVNGLQALIPSINYSSANPRNTALTIRGLGSSVVAVSQSNDGLEPGVGFYVDQVYHARPATAAFDFADIDQIEELRGPQGTLFGKNTTAGAINITSRAPSFTPEGYAEISAGSFNYVQARGWVSGPLADGVAFRISGVSTRRDGVIKDVRDGRDLNQLGTQAVRAQLLLKPSDRLQTRLIFDFTNFQATCCTQVFLRVGQSLRPPARQYPALAAALRYQPASTNPYNRVTDIDGPLNVDTNEGGLEALTDWNIGVGTVTAVTAWRWWNWDAENDRDYIGLPIQVSQHIPSRQDQYSQEIRLASNGDHRVTYVTGVYGFFQKIVGRPISIYGPSGAFYLIGPTTGTTAVPANLLDGYTQDGHTDFRSRSYAGFGEINVKLIDAVTATGGLRYTHEDKNGSYNTFTFGGPTITGTAAQQTALRNAQLGVLRGQSYTAHDDDGSLSGRGNLAWQVTDAVLAYGSYARGYKSGGINMSGLPLTAANLPALNTAVVRPERNTTIEAGLKTRLFDRRLVLDADVFSTRVRDFQATIVDTGPTQTAALRGYLSNIPRVTVKGVEADATALVATGLTLRANLAYADGKYADYPAGPCPIEQQTAATTACNLTGQRLSSLPRFALTAGIDYALPIGSGAAFVHVDTASRSGFNGDSALSRYTYIRGYNLTNASVGYRFGSGLELLVFARNLLDADYIQNLTVQAGNSGLILGNPSDPRTVGATLRFRH
ncbi:TonB-dependent receptor [Sphingomonas bacterium]|uniref:TonB-dependent receptor n=1 Tax=Sphingomonas bacterium TaxID=1895847 RepID=UPI0015760666|nr:TonB-dependent receptor [Sphingomonas bacterium]